MASEVLDIKHLLIRLEVAMMIPYSDLLPSATYQCECNCNTETFTGHHVSDDLRHLIFAMGMSESIGSRYSNNVDCFADDCCTRTSM